MYKTTLLSKLDLKLGGILYMHKSGISLPFHCRGVRWRWKEAVRVWSPFLHLLSAQLSQMLPGPRWFPIPTSEGGKGFHRQRGLGAWEGDEDMRNRMQRSLSPTRVHGFMCSHLWMKGFRCRRWKRNSVAAQVKLLWGPPTNDTTGPERGPCACL